LGISASYHSELTYDGKIERYDEDLYEGESPLQRFNICFTVGGGFEIYGFYIGIANDFGLTNQSIIGDNNSIRTNSLMMNIGYSF
jgi:hypothetical protein